MKIYQFVLLLCCMVCCGEIFSVFPAGGMVIDGRLEEPAWQKAPWSGGFTMLRNQWPKTPQPSQNTEFKLLADQDSIYVGIRCQETDMANLKAAHHGPSGASLWLDDLVEIYFSPTGQADEFYQFVIGAGNGSWQMFHGERGAVRPDPFAPFYEHQVCRGKDFYSVEIRIPLTALYMTSSDFLKKEWLFNVSRQKTPALWSSWAVLYSSFNEVERFHRIAGFPLRKCRNNIYIREIQAELASADRGSLIVKVSAEDAAAGEYSLLLSSEAWQKLSPVKIRLAAGDNTLKVEDVQFLKKGKFPVKVTLLDRSGKFAAGRYYDTAVNFQLFRLELTRPAYKNTFFPGQKADRLQGKIAFNGTVDRVCISTASGHTLLPVKNQMLRFDLPLRLAPGEDMPVKFEFIRGGKPAASREVVLRHLKPAGHRMVWIEEPGRIVRDGRTIFALGWYGDNSWKVSRPLREQFPRCGMKHPLNFMDKVVLEPERLVPGTEAREGVRDVKPCPEIFAKVRDVIQANRTKDFDYYYLCDEPECRGVSPVYLKYIYDYVSQLDPAHPVMIISRSPGRYLDCADILNPHPYLNPMKGSDGRRLLKSGVEVIRRSCREISRGGRSNQVIMLCPQVFSYAFCNNQADYPTLPETGASIWSAVCNGAQGITPFIWNAHMERPDLNFGMDFIFTSLDRLAPWITGGETAVPLESGNEMIDVRCFEHQGSYLLLAVNVSPQKQRLQLKKQSALPVENWQVFRENRVLRGAELAGLELASYQVLLLTSATADQGLETRAECLEKISRAEQDRRNRGNILFGRHKEIEISHSHCDYMYFSVMEQQDLMFDGNCRSLAWLPHRYKELWYEMMFPKFVPKFSRARIHGNGLRGMKFKIWKYGEWLDVPAAVKDGQFVREYDFGRMLSTVKIRLEFMTPKPGMKNRLELYEFELLK